VLVVDARDLVSLRELRPTAVKPNYREAVRLLALEETEDAARVAQMDEHGERLLELCEARVAAVTLDADGAIVFERGGPAYRSYANPTPNIRAAGAGDTFVAVLALSLAAGLPVPAVADLASAAAAVVLEREGTVACTASALRRRLSAAQKVVADARALDERLALERALGRRIVFTNGCFDILHRGHITYLDRAKALGDVLVVGLNSDASVARLKGSGRPVNPLEDRAEVLAALSCVDLVVPFEEDLPLEIIDRVAPDVFVKGGDYTTEMLPEAELVRRLGAELRILPYVEERSTSGIIERIRRGERPAAAQR
jgi:D-beta-D-heptose 7-phosphate kinase/D-beta-D-heptose 1-phosphate adenosyltransferase